MSEIVITEFMDEAAIAEILAGRDVLYDPKLVDDSARLHAALADARALIVRNRTQVRGVLLDAAPKLTVVGRLGVGLDNIDVAACGARNIAVFPASGANDLSVAEYVITAALILLRRAWFVTDAVIAGKWPRNAAMGGELAGKTIGLIGYGAIARETAARAASLGMHVIAFDPHLPTGHPGWRGATRKDLGELLAAADVVSLHVPLTAETRNIVDAAEISRMKKGAILINAARGDVINQAAVAAALKTGHLGGAALDVFAEEPLDAALGAAFADVPNLILTPHIAGVTKESNVRVSRVIAEKVLTALKG